MLPTTTLLPLLAPCGQGPSGRMQQRFCVRLRNPSRLAYASQVDASAVLMRAPLGSRPELQPGQMHEGCRDDV
jgi:hypothetical protein